MKKYIIHLLLLSVIISCDLKPDCSFLKTLNRQVACVAVVVSKPTHSDTFLKKGYHPDTGKPCTCKENDRWLRSYHEEMDVGDTIIKRAGDLFFEIHKSDTVIVHTWTCNGKVYK